MTGSHPDLGPELRQLAQSLLDRIDPAVRAAASLAGARADSGPGKCQQVWCPVCALAALVTGEEHPLLTVVSEHSVALLGVLRALLDDSAGDADSPRPPEGPPPGDAAPEPGVGRYEPIPVTIEE